MALIQCPECNGNVSDKAVICVHCGYPLKKEKVETKQKHKWKRLPNGFGSIKKMSGNRRRPYVAYPPVSEYTSKGYPIYKHPIGYFETYEDAYAGIMNYNRNPNEVAKAGRTFAEVYEEYFKDKFTDSKKAYSQSSVSVAKSGYKNLSALHSRPIANLRTEEMQKVVDSCKLKHASIEQMVMLLKSVCRFALQRDYIVKDYSQFVHIKIEDDDEKGVPFTENELAILWDNSDKYAIQILLILIYTGFRISELESAEINYEEEYFKGGLKTKAGKGRIIPFNNRIKPFIHILSDRPFKASTYREVELYPTLAQMGLNRAPTGEKHTPHDARHTFSWLADKYGVDNLSKHLLMGHSLSKNGVEDSVYGHRTIEELRAEINKIM